MPRQKGTRGAGEQPAEHEQAVCPGGQGSEWCPGVHWEKHCQQGKRGDSALLPGEAHPKCCVQFWVPQDKRNMERHTGPGETPTEDLKNGWKTGVAQV